MTFSFPEVHDEWDWDNLVLNLENSGLNLTPKRQNNLAIYLLNYDEETTFSRANIKMRNVNVSLTNELYPALQSLVGMSFDKRVKGDVLRAELGKLYRKSQIGWDAIEALAENKPDAICIQVVVDGSNPEGMRDLVWDDDRPVISVNSYVNFEIKVPHNYSYILVFHKGTSGFVYQLCPSYWNRSHLVKSPLIQVPQTRSPVLRVTSPGLETVLAVVASEPLINITDNQFPRTLKKVPNYELSKIRMQLKELEFTERAVFTMTYEVRIDKT